MQTFRAVGAGKPAASLALRALALTGLKALDQTVLTCQQLPDPSLPDGRLVSSH